MRATPTRSPRNPGAPGPPGLTAADACPPSDVGGHFETAPPADADPVPLDALAGLPIAKLAITGAPAPLDTMLPAAITSRAGAPLDPDVLRADLAKLIALGAIDQVELHAERDGGAVTIALAVTPRARIARVDVVGDAPAWARERLASLAGGLDDRGRTERLRRRLVVALTDDGYRDAAIALSEIRTPAGPAVCAAVHAGPRYVIDRFVITGNTALPSALIERRLARELGRIDTRGGVYREDLVALDLENLLYMYLDRGYASARIDTPTATYDRARGTVTVALHVSEGPLFHIGKIELTGAVDDEATYRRALGITSGQRFDRKTLAIAVERMKAIGRDHDRAIDLATSLDNDDGRIDLELAFTSTAAPRAPK